MAQGILMGQSGASKIQDLIDKGDLLWTNSSPTSSFTGKDITLSQSIDNYTYIAITYRGSTSYDKQATQLFSTEILIEFLNASSGTAIYPMNTISAKNDTSKDAFTMSRQIYANIDGGLYISDAYAGYKVLMNNDVAIPLYIYGIK